MIDIFANPFNVWLTGRQLDFQICFYIQSVTTSCFSWGVWKKSRFTQICSCKGRILRTPGAVLWELLVSRRGRASGFRRTFWSNLCDGVREMSSWEQRQKGREPRSELCCTCTVDPHSSSVLYLPACWNLFVTTNCYLWHIWGHSQTWCGWWKICVVWCTPSPPGSHKVILCLKVSVLIVSMCPFCSVFSVTFFHILCFVLVISLFEWSPRRVLRCCSVITPSAEECDAPDRWNTCVR